MAVCGPGLRKETEDVSLVSTRHSAPQFPLHPYTLFVEKRQLSCPDYAASSVPSNRPRKTFKSNGSRPKKGTGSRLPAFAGPRGPMRPSRGVPPRGGRGQNARELVHRSDLMSLESERRVLFSGSRSDDEKRPSSLDFRSITLLGGYQDAPKELVPCCHLIQLNESIVQ